MQRRHRSSTWRSHITSLGLKPQVIHGTHQTVIAALGEERPGLTEVLEPGEGVEKVLPIMAPYKRASSELKRERTRVKVSGLEVGGTKVAVIAGPCSVESEEQIVALARQLKELGATGLRGGAFKPRTSPYSFQGHKELGLKMLATARAETGLAIVTEVMAPEHVPSSPSTPTCSRSVPATCRTTSCSRPSATRASPRSSSAA